MGMLTCKDCNLKIIYENRLKADMVAVLTELQLEIIELPVHSVSINGSIIRMDIAPSAEDASKLIQYKINALKGDQDENNNKI